MSPGTGRLDGKVVLVTGAARGIGAAIADSFAQEGANLLLNQVGVFLGMRAVAPAMAAGGSGSIINVSSVAGLTGAPYLTAYAAGKWAVRGMTKAVAKARASASTRSIPARSTPTCTPASASALPSSSTGSSPPSRRGGSATPKRSRTRRSSWRATRAATSPGSELVIDGGVSA